MRWRARFPVKKAVKGFVQVVMAVRDEGGNRKEVIGEVSKAMADEIFGEVLRRSIKVRAA